MWKHIFLIIAFASFVYWALDMINWMGFFQYTYNHSPGSCRRISGIEYGSEDAQVLPSGLLIFTSGLRMKNSAEYNKRPGRIYLFDFNKPEDEAKEVKIIADPSYKLISPHGLNIWTDTATGTIFLYVISHHPQEIIDKFSFDEPTRTLTHLKRISGDPNFHQLNDIAVVGEDQFYFTNYWYIDLRLELLMRLHWGSLGFFSGNGSTILDKGFLVSSGIMISPDHKFLYVALAGDKEIRVYRRKSDNSLTYSHTIKVDSALDNLDVDMATGELWTGSHPVIYKIMAHLDNPVDTKSPSQALRIKLDADARLIEIEEVYANDGTELSGSTVAVVYGNRLFIGTVASHALFCQMK